MKSFDSPLDELAQEADQALQLCWERLQAKTIDSKTIRAMVEAWRAKRQAFLAAEEARENKRSDGK